MNTKIVSRALCLELRTYSLKPEAFPKYLALTNEKFHLRTAHSKLNGFWLHELGGLNSVTHLWEYDSLEHRAQVRDSLSVDKSWISEYVVSLLPMLAEQVNSVVYEPEWALPLKSNTRKGPFMMERITLAGEARDNEELVKALVVEKLDAYNLTNVLFTDVGPNNQVTLIWRGNELSDFCGWHRQASNKQGIVQRETIVMKGAPWCPTNN
ncbi:Oidioi.mRNA.OKI2018_I69.XSR.g14281.t1.cds [Oikopleura dioica]|uniref:Oidioi.mRNA.OKI2018_I69.XSR.g14281.t1.cds n=1 Tax=Oikopleura dioica TaxID=34765 RepID=A0ABN7SGK8_OIKDI|nr:Oidioi.mRNA.OKI2018_I69.XSR.g14281.t1.cds [Oikopleura dioica]